MDNAELIALVQKAQKGNKSAMNCLISSCYQDLYYYAYKTTNNEDLAADITQEGCLEIVTKLSSLREPAAFHVWSRRIIYHQCTHYFRDVREVTVSEDEDGETIFDRLPDESPDSLPEQVQEDKEFRQTLQKMLDSLSPEQRSAMVLYYYERLSVGQIAEIQGVSEGTVKSRLNYGRKAIKQKVEEYEKKTGVRLHGIAPLPLLLFALLRSEKKAAITKAMPTLAKIPVGTVAKAATTALAVKVAAGIVAAAVVVGGAIGIASHTQSNPGAQAIAPSVDLSLIAQIPDTWYKEGSAGDSPENIIRIHQDGTIDANGFTYHISCIETLEGIVNINYRQQPQEFMLTGIGYRIYFTTDLTGNSPKMFRLDLLPIDSSGTPCLGIIAHQPSDPGLTEYSGYDMYALTVRASEEPGTNDPIDTSALAQFAGQWEALCPEDPQQSTPFTLNADGTVRYCGKDYTPSEIWVNGNYNHIPSEGETVEEIDTVFLGSKQEDWLRIRIIRHNDGSYLAELWPEDYPIGEEDGVMRYYLPDQCQGYQKIPLTTENWQNYIHLVFGYIYGSEEGSDAPQITTCYQLWFKDGAAPMSYFRGDLSYTATREPTRFLIKEGYFESTGSPGEPYTGNLGTITVVAANVEQRFSLERHRETDFYNETYSGDNPTTIDIERVNFDELHAENVIGYVYMPIE